MSAQRLRPFKKTIGRDTIPILAIEDRGRTDEADYRTCIGNQHCNFSVSLCSVEFNCPILYLVGKLPNAYDVSAWLVWRILRHPSLQCGQ